MFQKMGESKCSGDTVVATGCLGPLQAMMFTRYMGIPHTEVWTAQSAKYVPRGQTPASLGAVLKQAVAANERLTGMLSELVDGVQRSWLFTDRHCEHAACELRKMLDNRGINRENGWRG